MKFETFKSSRSVGKLSPDFMAKDSSRRYSLVFNFKTFQNVRFYIFEIGPTCHFFLSCKLRNKIGLSEIRTFSSRKPTPEQIRNSVKFNTHYIHIICMILLICKRLDGATGIFCGHLALGQLTFVIN